MKASRSKFHIMSLLCLVMMASLCAFDHAMATDDYLFKSVEKPDFWEEPFQVFMSPVLLSGIYNVEAWRKWDVNKREWFLSDITVSLCVHDIRNWDSSAEQKPNDKSIEEMRRLRYLFWSQKVIIPQLITHIDSFIYANELDGKYSIVSIVLSLLDKFFMEFHLKYIDWKYRRDFIKNPPDYIKKNLEENK